MMIKVNRRLCPDALREAPTEGDHYNKPAIVDTLWNMQHGKCCYCEKKVPNEGHEKTVEHFRPKADAYYPELRNAWNNLLLACTGCNGKKSSHFPTDENEIPLLIDPSDPHIDPEEHLDFIVDIHNDEILDGAIIEKNSSSLGRTTIDTVGINRKHYIEMRRAKLVTIYPAFPIWIISFVGPNAVFSCKIKVLASPCHHLARGPNG